MNVAFIGCGFVADFYMATIHHYKQLNLIKVYDKNKERLKQFCDYYGVNPVKSVNEILKDDKIELIINLTNPKEHFNVNYRSLKNNKHVYTEKPLSMNFKDAKYLYDFAKTKKLKLSSAPSSVLNKVSKTVEVALKENKIGNVRLVYANFDAGMTHKMKPWNWSTPSGAFWPAQDEFETGCTYEHAGYLLTWLYQFFGPAKSVMSFSKCLLKDKDIKTKLDTPDFSVGCIEYKNVVARVTLSIVAPLDRSMTIVGTEGILYVPDVRNDNSSVYIKKIPSSKLEAALEYRIDHYKSKFENIINFFPWNWGNRWRFLKNYPLIKKTKEVSSGSYKPVDFCNGPAELVDSIEEKRDCILSPEMALNTTEIIEMLQYPEKFKNKKNLLSYSKIKV